MRFEDKKVEFVKVGEDVNRLKTTLHTRQLEKWGVSVSTIKRSCEFAFEKLKFYCDFLQ